MKKALFLLIITLFCLSCRQIGMSGASGELVGTRNVLFKEPDPYGMVLVKRGSIHMGPAEEDSLWGLEADTKGVSVSSFWMDDTEVTNAKYRQFVYWVRDSIIRERLADPRYGGNEFFKITEDKYGEPVTPHLDWSQPIPWKRATEEEERAIESLYITNPVTGEKKLDPKQMVYRYEWYDHAAAALRENSMDPTARERNTDKEVDLQKVVMIAKDTAYVDDNGNVVNETITRPRSGPWDFLHTRIAYIYPDETVWVNDFDNSMNEPYLRMYFTHAGYDDYPVVGVSWEAATAFCAWRTEQYKRFIKLPAGMVIEPFRLPTEGEWEYAARAGNSENVYPWATDGLQTEKGCFMANFKPGEGNYTEDGHLITSRVAIYPPNEFGLYDMAGNVSEWTSTTFLESGPSRMGDMNPVLNYHAATEDRYDMKKKVVRGGSWKDISQFIRSDMRSYEYQNETRSYIGFRCVRTHVDFLDNKRRK